VATPQVLAQGSSYRNSNPIENMHLLPVGEAPGWTGRFWIQSELAQNNTWNFHIDLRDLDTGHQLGYEADYEQTSAIADLGYAINQWVAAGLEIQTGYRSGGFMDHYIDMYHAAIGTDRFDRNQYPIGRNEIHFFDNGVDAISTPHNIEFANIKLKAKVWFVHWVSPHPAACDCGLAVSGQIHIPVAGARSGWSSGGIDTSLLLHAGYPINEYSGIWATFAITHAPVNAVLAGWPRRAWLEMYELALDSAVSDHWGIVTKARANSPFMNQGSLITLNTPDDFTRRRISSSWNSLGWRGSEELGLRYRWDGGDEIMFSMVEDWGLSAIDGRSGALYVNNAPDIIFSLQAVLHLL
jgi:hypothetical protein